MKASAILSTAVLLSLATCCVARADRAIGVVFGYPGNAGLSVRLDHTLINAAWSSDFIHATLDKWVVSKPLKNPKMSLYAGPGADAGFPINSDKSFFLAFRVPFGLLFAASPKIEVFGELAPGLQVLDETDFYWAGSAGLRFVLGGK